MLRVTIKKTIPIFILGTLALSLSLEARSSYRYDDDYDHSSSYYRYDRHRSTNKENLERYERKKTREDAEKAKEIEKHVTAGMGFLGALLTPPKSTIEETCTKSGGKGYSGRSSGEKISNCIIQKRQEEKTNPQDTTRRYNPPYRTDEPRYRPSGDEYY